MISLTYSTVLSVLSRLNVIVLSATFTVLMLLVIIFRKKFMKNHRKTPLLSEKI